MRRPTKSAQFNRAHGTPAFPVHPEGYDPKAPDAKPSANTSAKPADKK